MSKPLLSSDWYRLRALKPRLRGHVRLLRHAYRGQVWYVIEDRVGGKHHRFNFSAYRVISLMDGRRDMDGCGSVLLAELSDATPTQDEVVRLLGQLHAADLVQVDISPDVAELFERRGKQQRRKWMGRVGQPDRAAAALVRPRPAAAGHAALARAAAGLAVGCCCGWRWCCRRWCCCPATGAS